MQSGASKRKLTTVLAADVVGYSRLVAADDESAIRRLQQLRDVVRSLVERHDGRWFGEAGDSLMAEFPSAVEAARCALEIQNEIAARNRDIAADRAMLFRIGINLGETIVEGDNLYGDGVNVAARLQEIAEPGGIVLSASAYEQVRTKVAIEVEPLGPRALKNIPELVTAFRARTATRGAVAAAVPRTATGGWKRRAVAAGVSIAVIAGGAIAWDTLVAAGWRLEAFRAQAAQPVPEEPSIVVMPFLNASENEAQEYFVYGITEDIMTNLTKVSGLFVVGRDSAMSFKGKPVPARQVGRALGVRYVLQGSVRRTDAKVRITSYLVDAATEKTLWAARYDRELGDIFAVQDDIAERIVTALSVSFRSGERENVQQRPQVAQLPLTYDLFLQARRKMIPPSPGNLADAEQLFKEVIKSDPDFAGGHAGLALAMAQRVNQGFIRAENQAERDSAVKVAIASATEALKLDRRSTMAMYAMASALLAQGDQEGAVRYAREAYSVQPGDAYFAATLGIMLTFAGNPEDAFIYIDQAIERERVTAYRARGQFFKLAAAYTAGDYIKAEQAYLGHLEAGGQCFSDCLFYAASSKLRLAEQATSADEKARLAAQGRAIARTLQEKYPDYERSRLPGRIAVFKEQKHREHMRADAQTITRLREAQAAP
jgi:TolB-like protein/class 3 adenylate cyclase